MPRLDRRELAAIFAGGAAGAALRVWLGVAVAAQIATNPAAMLASA